MATTQKYAGMPVKLPYNDVVAFNGGHLSPPEILKQPPVIQTISKFAFLTNCDRSSHHFYNWQLDTSFQIIPGEISKRLGSATDLSDLDAINDDSLELSDLLDQAVPFHTLLVKKFTT